MEKKAPLLLVTLSIIYRTVDLDLTIYAGIDLDFKIYSSKHET